VALLLVVAACRSRPPYEGKSVAELERMLGDPDPAVQVQGAFGLGQRGKEAAAAAPSLIAALRSDNALLRQHAARALGGVGVPEAVPALTAALRRAAQDALKKVREGR
jgi:HEAT repeat protein